MSDVMAIELRNVLGVDELPKECERWNDLQFQAAIDAFESGVLGIVVGHSGTTQFLRVSPPKNGRSGDPDAECRQSNHSGVDSESIGEKFRQAIHAENLNYYAMKKRSTESSIQSGDSIQAVESDYAATVKALSEAIQMLAKEQKQTYASCNTLSNTLAEVVRQRIAIEESRQK